MNDLPTIDGTRFVVILITEIDTEVVGQSSFSVDLSRSQAPREICNLTRVEKVYSRSGL